MEAPPATPRQAQNVSVQGERSKRQQPGRAVTKARVLICCRCILVLLKHHVIYQICPVSCTWSGGPLHAVNDRKEGGEVQEAP
jgi:hypothetical protein